jgi:hypothetical protein
VVIHKGKIKTTSSLADLAGRTRTMVRWTGGSLPGAQTAASGEHSLAFAERGAASDAAAKIVREGGRLLDLVAEKETLEAVFTRMTAEA